MEDLEKSQAEILGTDIDSNPYMTETVLYSTNKGLKTVKKNVIAAINELLECIRLAEVERQEVLEILGGALGDELLDKLMEAQGGNISQSKAGTSRIYRTLMHDAINDSTFTEGELIRTLGFEEAFDGGAGYYYIRESNENRPWAIELRSGQYACLASLP